MGLSVISFGKDMSREYRTFIKGMDEGLEKTFRRSDLSICVFLLGPGDSDKSDGKAIRKYLKRKCEEFGVVVKGEHKELIESFNSRTENLLNLCVMERWFAQKHANAVVIIPYSAGSLVEMGMFTFQTRICRKTMLIFSKEFAGDEDSFIHKGTRVHYGWKGARVTFIDYNNKKAVWKEVHDFLSNYKAEKLEKVLFRMK